MSKFQEAHVAADIRRMKLYASALQQFSKVVNLKFETSHTDLQIQGYSKCVDSFIQNSLLVSMVCII